VEVSNIIGSSTKYNIFQKKSREKEAVWWCVVCPPLWKPWKSETVVKKFHTKQIKWVVVYTTDGSLKILKYSILARLHNYK
jgi:hypothetical protein